MYEIDFLPVGDGENSGDAIALRFTDPTDNSTVVCVIDAGFKDDGDVLVHHVLRHYGTDVVDLAILTHPDGDHIGGMGQLLRGLRVQSLWLHDLAAHGGGDLAAAKAVNEVKALAGAEGTAVFEAFAGAQAFGGALTVLGPASDYYDTLVDEQLEREGMALSVAKTLREAGQGILDRAAAHLGGEIPFDDKEVTPRNNSSMITSLLVGDQHLLFTGDAGAPALERAWEFAGALGRDHIPRLVQIPHHGSRRNASSAWLDRLLGRPGQSEQRTAYVSVSEGSPKHPSGRVVNAYMRRGCRVYATAGTSKLHHSADAPDRRWGPATPLPAQVEEPDE